jgi:hypothetical protein
MLPVPDHALATGYDAAGCDRADPPAVDPAAFAPWAERRLAERFRARPGSAGEVRVGWIGGGPDLGAGLVDVSAEGLQVLVRAPVRAGDRVLVGLTPPQFGWAVARVPAEVRWYAGGRAGVRLIRPLTEADLEKLAG